MHHGGRRLIRSPLVVPRISSSLSSRVCGGVGDRFFHSILIYGSLHTHICMCKCEIMMMSGIHEAEHARPHGE